MSAMFRVQMIVLVLLSGALCAAEQEEKNSTSERFVNLAEIADFQIDPVPSKAGQPVVFSGGLKNGAKIKADVASSVSITLNFGDGTFQSIALADVKNPVPHTYAVAGVYEARLTVSASGFFDQISSFVIVGDGTVVNPLNGLSMTATDANGQSRSTDGAGSRFVGGVVNVAVNISRTFGSTATTDFEDIPGRQSVNVPGLNVQHTFGQKGIFVATSRSKDFAGTEVAKMRQMLLISSSDAGESGALPDAPSTEITLKKLSGKFLFTKSTPDLVQFSGTIQLPKGFDPARAEGNSLTLGIGNNVDTVLVDSKGKAKLPGTSGRVTKAKVKYPKLSGPAAGGEVAQIDFAISVADLDTNGFDTEGITATLRNDEFGMKAVKRLIQVGLVFGGAPYESLLPVDYKLSKKADAGQIAGRVSKP